MEVNLIAIGWFLWIITWVGIKNICCQKPNLDAILNRRQDVYIAGFFPFGKGVEQSGTGRGVMPSVKLALDHVNEHETVLRNYRLHMWWNDTECNAAVGVKSFFDMMHSGPHKLMLFGAACTHVTDPIAKASKHWHLTQLSYADTHPMFTKDAFPNFFRIVPSENAFNLPRLELLKHFNWTRVGTIYQNEPRYALAHNRLVADLDAENFIVEETQSFATEVRTALTKLKEKDIRIILGNFNETWAIRVFCEAYRLEMYGRTYQWLIQGTYSENWWRRRAPCARQHLTAALDTVILTDLLPLSTTGEVTISGITAKEYQVEYDRRRGSEYSRFHGYTYDGIWAVALAIQNVAQRAKQKHKERGVADFKYRDKDWEEMFLEALSNVSFEGVTGPVRFHNNERRASILLKQFQGEELGEVKVGEYCSELSRLDLATGLPFKWGGKYPPKDRTLHQIEHTQVNITIYAVLASCSVLGIMLATCFLAMNIHYRNQRYIKMSSPHLNNLIIVGCILTYLSVIFLGLDSGLSSIAAFPYICTARAWLLMAGFSLAFGAMFSKTWRVHSIFTDVKLNKKVIKDYQLFMVVGVLLAIDLAIMTTWQISDPFYRATKQMEPYPHPSSEDILIVQENEYCQSERMTIFIGIIYAYKGLLLVFGAFLAWETRHVSIPALNDSKHIGLSVYNVLIMCIMGAAIALVLTDHKDALFVLIAIFIIFCTTGTLCLVFVPKLLELRRNGQPGTTDKGRMRATLRPTGKARDCRSPGAELEARLRDLRTHNHKFRRTLQARDNEIQMLLSKLGSDATSITSSVKTDSKSPTVPGRNVRLNVPPNVTKDAPSQMDTSDITSLCSLSASQGAEAEYYNVGVDRPKPQPSAPPHETSKSECVEPAPVKASTGSKREAATKNVSFKNHLDYSGGSNANHSGAVRNVPEKDQLAKFPYGWAQEEPQTQPAASPPTTQPPTQPIIRHQEPSESIPLPTTTTAPTPVAPAPVRSHRRTTSVSRPTAELKMQVPPPDFPPASERKIIGAERDEQASCPLRRQMTFDAGQDLDVDKNYSTAERKKISQRRDSEKRRNNFIVAQSDLWDTNTFTYNCPKPQAATHHHSPMQRSVSEKNQRHSSQSGTPTHHSTSRESETKHHSGDRRSSNASMHSTHGASSVGGDSRSSRDSLLAARGSTPEGYRDAETLRMHDRATKRRGSEFPQPVSTPTHQSQQKRRQSCAQVRSIADERPTPPPQPPASLAVVPATPRSPARPVLDRTDTPRHLQPHHHQSTPNVGAARQKKSSPSKTRSRRSTPTAPQPAPLSTAQPQARKMYSASSESELFECAILPIFHKLLTERHKSQPHGLNLVYGVSCPNISIKCDIVEYL